MTPTYTATPAAQAIENLKPYPNPVYPGTNQVNFRFTLNQKDCDRIGLRIYTASYRLIREVVYENPALATIINNGLIMYSTTDNFKGLANGTYYYFIYVEKNKVETRSRIDKIIILK